VEQVEVALERRVVGRAHDVGVDAADVRGLEHGHDRGEPAVGRKVVVGRHHHTYGMPRQRDTQRNTRLCQPLRVVHQLVAVALDQLACAVGRSAVDDDHLHQLRWVVLPADAVEAARQQGCGVEDGNHDRDPRAPVGGTHASARRSASTTCSCCAGVIPG
jgi:hypothetical protein